jgi:hypothetical protein
MSDQVRIESLSKEDLGLYIDFSRQRMTQDTLKVRPKGGGVMRLDEVAAQAATVVRSVPVMSSCRPAV